MVNADIMLRDGTNRTVESLKIVKKRNSQNDFVNEITDFSSFFISPGPYLFIGYGIVAVDGDDILSVEFNR